MRRAPRGLSFHNSNPQMRCATQSRLAKDHKGNSGKITTASIRGLLRHWASYPVVLHSSKEEAVAHFTDEKTKAQRTMTDTRTHGQDWGQSQTQAVA